MTFTRTVSNLIGTQAAPVSITTSPANGTLAIANGGPLKDGLIVVVVTIGSTAPPVPPIVQFSYTLDGTNYVSEQGPYNVPLTVSTQNPYTYTIPDKAVGGSVTVGNNGSSTAITVWAQGSTLGIS
jgi:hypothetical protein